MIGATLSEGGQVNCSTQLKNGKQIKHTWTTHRALLSESAMARSCIWDFSTARTMP